LGERDPITDWRCGGVLEFCQPHRVSRDLGDTASRFMAAPVKDVHLITNLQPQNMKRVVSFTIRQREHL
jgi:hypothetical protein